LDSWDAIDGEKLYSKCDVKHKFFGGKSWEKHTQEGAKPL